MIQYPHKSIFGEESLVLSNGTYQVEICDDKVNIFRGDRVWQFHKEDSIEIATVILQKFAPELLLPQEVDSVDLNKITNA